MVGPGPDGREVISNYRLDRVIGRGGMGVVYEATDTRNGTKVALKLLHEDLEQDTTFRERFQCEAHVAALLRSPYTVHLIDYGLEQGFKFFFLTPKTRHTTHSGWAVTDWETIWGSNFGDPHRRDTRLPHLGDREVHINPADAKELGIEDGDYVYVDANPMDRPYPNYDPNDTSDPFHKVARLMLRAKYNAAYPRGVLMAKHGYWLATQKTVLAHETRPDGRAVSADTGYQSSYRYGSHQSVTRDWAMPMHQTDTLFHKKKIAMAFMFGGEADNHAINTVPKETLVRIVKAEDGGLGGEGVWAPATTGTSPGNEDERMKRYLSGEFVS